MFKKLIEFFAWAILLCLLFVFCLCIAVISERSFTAAVILWFALIIAVLVVRLIWFSLRGISQSKYVLYLKQRLTLTRMEHVLFEHWKAGESVIKRIKRRKQHLPWFILTGKRSGKTTLMASAGLPLFSNEPESALVVPTRTLRWWFFHSSGFLDLSSHFLSKTPAFERGWLNLVNWCQRVPSPAGIVVCVSIADLRGKEAADLHLNARLVRTQIEPLIKKLKRRLPVYLFVTCCDQIAGFSQWASKLSPAQRQQALGYYWLTSPVVDGKDPALLDPLFTCVKDGLDKVRVSMLSGGDPDNDTLSLLDFPEQLMQLQPALQRYLAALCEPDAYFEPAQLGGIWFSATEQVSKNSAARKALFTHNLISHLLPTLSRQREIAPIGFSRRYFQRWGVMTFSVLASLYLAWSGASSYGLGAGNLQDMTPEQQVQQLKGIESWNESPLQHLLFVPLLNQRHHQLEETILAATPRSTVNMQAAEQRYQQLFAEALPQGKRELVLNLASAIMTKQAMLDGQSLAELEKHPPVSPLLSLTGADSSLPLAYDIALQRELLQQPGGVEQLNSLRKLLGQLVNSDTSWTWLIAPSQALTPVNLVDFLPWAQNNVQLDGLWTVQGSVQLQHWLDTVRQAAGKNVNMPVLAAFEQNWNTLRQNQWMTLILAMSNQPAPVLNGAQWQSTLVSIDQGNSPSMAFAHYATEQLADIPGQHASRWLRELRQLEKLQQTPLNGSVMNSAGRLEKAFLQKVASVIKLDNKTLNSAVSDLNIKNWLAWKGSLRAAVSDAFVTPVKSERLTRGLFLSGEDAAANPLQQLDTRFATLRKSVSAEQDDFALNAVWALYKTDAHWLVAHAMQRSGCWLQDQWQSRVLWPMEKNAARLDYKEQQELSGQYLADFIRGPAKSVLVVGDNGPAAGQFDGLTTGLTPEFLRMVNHVLRPDDVLAMPERDSTRNDDVLASLKEQQSKLETQITALEAKSIEITLKSQPATIPGGARLMPTGTRVTLFCDEQRWTLSSMNFSEQAPFRWRPGHCSRITLVVNFPGFDLTYEYFGDSAWTDFLEDMSDGQHRYLASDFPEDAAQLDAMGIKEVLVRYQTGPQDKVRETWQQWQALNQSLNDNADAQLALQDKKAQQRSAVPNNHFSQLPARIAQCQ
ncbi:type VI secretion system protein [Buttiauxella ferragutiae]|uniref:type VI secretion system protein n=1 Tax=Buttiauxella ferragutiae TaxID=82989 RepID=UPI001F52CE4C|nr:type VI secretion system protein [Buttiauxella ferragutiae]UNK62964.1 type VI secretion system protein [Buttiauxella ferragutiae]